MGGGGVNTLLTIKKLYYFRMVKKKTRLGVFLRTPSLALKIQSTLKQKGDNKSIQYIQELFNYAEERKQL